jgi:hypothetical protein
MRFAKTHRSSLNPSCRDGTTRPSQGLALDAGNEIIVFRWRPNESKLPKALVTNEKRLSHLSVAEIIFFEALTI